MESVLDHLVQSGLAVHDEGRYLALALADGTADPSLETRRQHMKARLNEPPDKPGSRGSIQSEI